MIMAEGHLPMVIAMDATMATAMAMAMAMAMEVNMVRATTQLKVKKILG